jgi:type VI secretion system protein ImpL
MKKHVPAFASAGGVLAIFGVAAFRLPIQATGWVVLLIRGGILAIGIALAVIVLLYMRARMRAKQDAEAASGCEDIDQAFAAAVKHLSAARLAKDTRIGRMPLMLVIGPAGSTKTSVLTHSGLDPELLAGEVMRGDTVMATDPLNLWYAQGVVIVEAGGRLLEDERRWRRLMHHIRPSRVAAAFGRRQQPARFAVLCIGCDEFQKPGASQNLAAAARTIRTRLGEAAQLLGIRLPVYTLFTRADRLPYFPEYVRSFTTEEAQQVLGATLPLDLDSSGTWAEREARRLNEAFARIVRALTARRLDVLLRESEESTRAAAYEFPRELRRIAEPAVQLLLDIFRPSQLSVHAFLRGFYFTGVRPIILRDLAAQASPQASAPVLQSGATQVFNAAAMLQQVQQVPVIGPTGRKVPQWVFVDRLFRDVMLADRTVATITGGGARVDLLRRSLVGGVAAAAIVFALGFTTSYASNRGMLTDAKTVATSAANEQPRDARGELLVLDSLREQLVDLRGHSPVLSGWFLSRHDEAREALRAQYFERLQRTMWGPTRNAIVAYLSALPAEPNANSNFTLAHDALAAYMLTTSESQRREPGLFADAAMRFWPGKTANDTINEVARAQFYFLGEELPEGNPYSDRADPDLVATRQNFIALFGPTAFYESLAAMIDGELGPVRWTDQAIVRNTESVGGSYTIAGWRRMTDELAQLDEFIEKRKWLYGPQGPRQKPDPENLRLQYEGHYIAAWQRFISKAEIVSFSSIPEAATRLAVLGSPTSPLFLMLQKVVDNTSNTSVETVHHAFMPLRAVVPPTEEGGPTSLAAGFTSTLNTMSQHLRAAQAPGGDAMMAQSFLPQLSSDVANIARSDGLNVNARQTLTLIQTLLRQIEFQTSQVIRDLEPTRVNNAGASFCSGYSTIARSYPFNRASNANADVAEVAEMFRKDDGTLALFAQSTLSPYLTPTGARVPGSPPINEAWQGFMRAASQFGTALASPSGPSVRFNLTLVGFPDGLTEAALLIDGASQSWTPTNMRSRRLEWPLLQYTRAQLVVRIGANEVIVANPDPGPWAIFRLFDEATWSEVRGQQVVAFRVEGQPKPLQLAIDFNAGPPVLARSFTAPLRSCPGRILP